MTLEEFYRICDAIEPDEHGCHPWPGSRTKRNYGRVTINGVSKPAHRPALERKLGRRIKPGLLALHNCDNPPCVNPEHLYEGTDADNIRDRMERNISFPSKDHRQQLIAIAKKADIEWIKKYREDPKFRAMILESLKNIRAAVRAKMKIVKRNK